MEVVALLSIHESSLRWDSVGAVCLKVLRQLSCVESLRQNSQGYTAVVVDLVV